MDKKFLHKSMESKCAILNNFNMGKLALFSSRAWYDAIEFWNCRIEELEAKLSSFVQFENEMVSYRALSTTSYVLTVLEHSHIQSDVIACTVLW